VTEGGPMTELASVRNVVARNTRGPIAHLIT
jgi:hypothetical protein